MTVAGILDTTAEQQSALQDIILENVSAVCDGILQALARINRGALTPSGPTVWSEDYTESVKALLGALTGIEAIRGEVQRLLAETRTDDAP